MEMAQRLDESSLIVHSMPSVWVRFKAMKQVRRCGPHSYTQSLLGCVIAVVLRQRMPAITKDDIGVHINGTW